ncbi:hypothetical protein HELRODRAFT_177590 [Helobdella robusta]|uniref:Ricin B lectin domain-containing protein n=1 Tax=Helobdella robusta TaxID=6412 RepID=T1FBW9_HELRO|nr:hypothetical protein HELRODRAFT_177590 [Helobdella robusta]ESN97928.1 hypothetical protein HELRODRAFT_177590 [Helobdella robusta]
MAGQSVEFQNKTGQKSQKWIINEHGYLVSEINGFGIDVDTGSQPFCGQVVKKYDPFDTKDLLGYKLKARTFQPNKNSMMWRPTDNGEILKNVKLKLTLKFVRFQECTDDSSLSIHTLALFRNDESYHPNQFQCIENHLCKNDQRDFERYLN